MLELRFVGGCSSALLLFWIAICITDVNHPPGTRWVRLAAVAFVFGTMALETIKPWRGFALYLLLWPQALLLRELLGRYISPLFAGPGPGGLPDLWAGGMTSALAVALWIRSERAARSHIAISLFEPAWSKIFRIALWVFVIGWTVAAIAGFARLVNPAESWQVDAPDWRHLLVPSMSRTNILYSLHTYLPAYLLGIMMLATARDFQRTSLRAEFIPPARQLALAAGCAGVVVALQVLWQSAGDWMWPFSWQPLAGPFASRNTSGPVLVVLGLLLLAGTWRFEMPLRMLGLCGVAVAWGAAFMVASRNGVMMLLLLPWLALFFRAGRGRLLAALLAPVVAIFLMLWMPLPKSEEVSNPTLNRIVSTVTALKQRNWKEFTSVRVGLWETALTISKAYPVTGAGPGSFPMLAHPESKFRSAETMYVYGSAHSVPLNLLAETGPITVLAWLALFVGLPWTALVRWKRANLLALTVLLIGIGNFFDTMMLVSGVTTLCVLAIVWAICEETSIQPESA